MSILYRPVTHKKGEMYSIKAYDGELKEELFSEIGMDIHFGALFFLLNLQMDLLKSILSSSMEKVTNRNISKFWKEVVSLFYNHSTRRRRYYKKSTSLPTKRWSR